MIAKFILVSLLFVATISCDKIDSNEYTAKPPLFVITDEIKFNGSSSNEIQIPINKDFLINDFAINFQMQISDQHFGNFGDVFSVINTSGLHLGGFGILNSSAACTSMSNTRNLLFGFDSSSNETWKDMGRPGNAILVFALAVYEGHLYAGTFEAGRELRGRVLRYLGNGTWEDCGAPWEANAITSLAIHKGRLYAASSRYHEDDPKIAEQSSQADGGELFRYEGGKTWTRCGKVGPAEFVYGMVSAGDNLFITLMDSPKRTDSFEYGLYRYNPDGSYTFLGNPGGRVASIIFNSDKLWLSGYDGGEMGGLFTYSEKLGWESLGSPANVWQTYSITQFRGQIHMGTWPEGKVFEYNNSQSTFYSLGRLGDEDEVMGMMVYNGALYAGTLPSANVYRYMPEYNSWKLVGELDMFNAGRRRAWGMAIYQSHLVCSTLPSGRVFGMETGDVITYDHSLSGQWHNILAQKRNNILELYIDNKLIGRRQVNPQFNATMKNSIIIRLGAGPQGHFIGNIRNFSVYDQPLTPANFNKIDN